MPRLFWSKKSCENCKGAPTPPPCYNCTFSLRTPPPEYTTVFNYEHTYTDVHSHRKRRTTDPPRFSLTNSLGITYPQDCVNNGSVDLHTNDGIDFELASLPHAVGRIALAFLGDTHTQQGHAHDMGAVDGRRGGANEDELSADRRRRHRSSPRLTTRTHNEVSHSYSSPQLSSYVPQNSLLSGDDAARSGDERANHLLLSAVSQNLPEDFESNFDIALEPTSPRGASPLPCQLLIPE